eukprot:3386542-Amphidinium_carterae.1
MYEIFAPFKRQVLTAPELESNVQLPTEVGYNSLESARDLTKTTGPPVASNTLKEGDPSPLLRITEEGVDLSSALTLYEAARELRTYVDTAVKKRGTIRLEHKVGTWNLLPSINLPVPAMVSRSNNEQLTAEALQDHNVVVAPFSQIKVAPDESVVRSVRSCALETNHSRFFYRACAAVDALEWLSLCYPGQQVTTSSKSGSEYTVINTYEKLAAICRMELE